MDDFPIFLRLFQEWGFASTSTESEVIVGTELPLSELGCFTASKFEYLSQILEKFLELYRVVLWSDVYRSIIDFFSGHEDLGKFLFGDFDIYVAIIGFE